MMKCCLEGRQTLTEVNKFSRMLSNLLSSGSCGDNGNHVHGNMVRSCMI